MEKKPNTYGTETGRISTKAPAIKELCYGDELPEVEPVDLVRLDPYDERQYIKDVPRR
jgi:hypothetical protein